MILIYIYIDIYIYDYIYICLYSQSFLWQALLEKRHINLAAPMRSQHHRDGLLASPQLTRLQQRRRRQINRLQPITQKAAQLAELVPGQEDISLSEQKRLGQIKSTAIHLIYVPVPSFASAGYPPMVWYHHGGGGTPALVCTCVFYTPVYRTNHSTGGRVRGRW